ncbi:MAG: DMT family transporter, partial [Burkholderiaceae bacterium]
AGVYLKLVCVALFWGGTFIAGRRIAQAAPFLTAAAIRFAIAVPLLVAIAWKTEGGLPRLSARQVASTFVLGLTGIFLYNVCFFSALSRMPAGRTALFVALNPIVTTLMLAAFFRERIGAARWLGIAIAFAGAAVVITRGDLTGAFRDLSQSFGAGEAQMCCGITGWAVYTIVGRQALKGLSPIAATAYAAIWGFALLAVASVSEWRALDPAAFGWPVLVSIAYLGVFGTVVGFIWYYEGVQAIGPSRTAVFNNLVPVFGILLAAGLLGEPVLPSMLAGGALVVGGVMLTNRGR